MRSNCTLAGTQRVFLWYKTPITVQQLIIAGLCLLIFNPQTIYAQKVELGLFGGVATYSGDLSSDQFGDYLDQSNLALGIYGRYHIDETFAARLTFSYGSLEGDDAQSLYPDRGLNFQTDLIDVALTAEWKLLTFGYEGGSWRVSPYVFGGVGLFNFNPKATIDGGTVELQPIGTEGQGLDGYPEPYRLTQFNIPIGAGIQIELNNKWTIGLEVGGRKLFTDHLDDVSNSLVSYDDIFFGKGELAARLSNPSITNPEGMDVTYRRGSIAKDWYYLSGLTVGYKFGGGGSKGFKGKKDFGCPSF